MSDRQQFSLNNIRLSSRGKVMRIDKSNSLDLFSKEMYGDQLGEFLC